MLGMDRQGSWTGVAWDRGTEAETEAKTMKYKHGRCMEMNRDTWKMLPISVRDDLN
ncbi:hypothetical protein BJY01DRAFT_224392 [Aspergillus pseudoustus]|uniref:Uncharacterized protein n=1 Tax=Aspergillus pseudoustus TaxID=1810923 RepID=A0ABR4J2H8_9EURO